MMFEKMMFAALFPFLLGAAEPVIDWSPANPDDFGPCRVYAKKEVKAEADGLRFEGKNPHVFLFTPEFKGAVTWQFQFQLDELPAKLANIVVRRGFNHAVGCLADGRMFIEVWNNDKKKIRIYSSTKLQPGKSYDITAVYEPSADSTTVKLYLDGKLEKEGTLPGVPRKYDKELLIGCANPNPDGKWSFPMKGILKKLRVFNGVVTPSAETTK